MILSKRQKMLVGGLTTWITLYPILFMIVWLIMFAGIFAGASGGGDPSPLFAAPFLVIFPLHCLTMVIMIGLLVFYLAHVIKNRAVSDTVRIIAGVGLFFVGFVVMPLYFYFFIWQETPPDWAIDQPAGKAGY